MRTRFPPSPTGMLHIGALRTALINYLVAKKEGGTFFMRIEDTDQAREVQGATENFLQAMTWAGVVPDEGVMLDAKGVVTEKGSHGPYWQSKRLDIYKKYSDELISKGHAYPCFCTADRLEKMRQLQQERSLPPMYDRTCRKLSVAEVSARLEAGEKHVIRLKVPDHRTVTFEDDIRGSVSFQSHTIDDQVLLKSDGFPTYHLAHVVDDHLMDTTVVIRGEEWLSSLPKHLLLFEAFGWEVPRYAHVPLLLNADRSKLSKRQGSVSVEEYINKGYLPEALVNFIALLGWNPGTTQEIFSMQELIEQFSLDRMQKAGAIFDTQKLDWLQGQWMRAIPMKDFVKRVQILAAEKFPAAAHDKSFAKKAELIRERITFFSEAPDMLGFFYESPTVQKEMIASAKQKVTADMLPHIFNVLTSMLEGIDDWNAKTILEQTKQTMAKENLKLGQLLWPLRVALTGREYSPGAVEVAEVLGKEETLKRVKAAQ